MKKLYHLFLRWRYRRIYRKLFYHYMRTTLNPDCAYLEAKNAFLYLTGKDVEELHCVP